MCFDHDALPPVPPIEGGAVSHEDLVLEAADGNRFSAFAAHPDEPSGKGVVILPDVRGLYRFYEELALRFAERGIEALAIDYFGRTAGVDKRGEDFEYQDHVAQTTPEGSRPTFAPRSSTYEAPHSRSPRSGSASAAGTRGFPPPTATA
jgi:carboxymethylenebutenolidase